MTDKKGGWNYRVVCRRCPPLVGGSSYAIHEVYYTNGEPAGLTADNVSPGGDTPEEFQASWEDYRKALNKPVLIYDGLNFTGETEPPIITGALNKDGLKPCPYCGSQDIVLQVCCDNGEAWEVWCHNPDCPDICEYPSRAEAIKAWNTRADTDEIEKLTRERDEARTWARRYKADYETMSAYADKLAAGLPMLPKDVEVIRQANFGLAQQVYELEQEAKMWRDAAGIEAIDLIKHNLERMRAIETEQQNKQLRGLLDRMAAELEAVYKNTVEICWEEPGEGSPALIEYKNWKEKGS